jgi:hypothetical protein
LGPLARARARTGSPAGQDLGCREGFLGRRRRFDRCWGEQFRRCYWQLCCYSVSRQERLARHRDTRAAACTDQRMRGPGARAPQPGTRPAFRPRLIAEPSRPRIAQAVRLLVVDAPLESSFRWALAAGEWSGPRNSARIEVWLRSPGLHLVSVKVGSPAGQRLLSLALHIRGQPSSAAVTPALPLFNTGRAGQPPA